MEISPRIYQISAEWSHSEDEMPALKPGVLWKTEHAVWPPEPSPTWLWGVGSSGVTLPGGKILFWESDPPKSSIHTNIWGSPDEIVGSPADPPLQWNHQVNKPIHAHRTHLSFSASPVDKNWQPGLWERPAARPSRATAHQEKESWPKCHPGIGGKVLWLPERHQRAEDIYETKTEGGFCFVLFCFCLFCRSRGNKPFFWKLNILQK